MPRIQSAGQGSLTGMGQQPCVYAHIQASGEVLNSFPNGQVPQISRWILIKGRRPSLVFD